MDRLKRLLEDLDAPKFEIETTMKKDIRSKKGWEIKAGEKVTARMSDKSGKALVATIRFARPGEEHGVLTYVKNAHNYSSAFTKEPSVQTMEKWMEDSIAKTITGKRTEPDGYGPDGSPSWLLVLGMI